MKLSRPLTLALAPFPLSVQRFDWKCKREEMLTNHADGERELRPQAVCFSKPASNLRLRFSCEQTDSKTDLRRAENH